MNDMSFALLLASRELRLRGLKVLNTFDTELYCPGGRCSMIICISGSNKPSTRSGFNPANQINECFVLIPSQVSQYRRFSGTIFRVLIRRSELFNLDIFNKKRSNFRFICVNLKTEAEDASDGSTCANAVEAIADVFLLFEIFVVLWLRLAGNFDGVAKGTAGIRKER